MIHTNHKEILKDKEYNVGDYDRRPWGFWSVTDVPVMGNLSYCEKIIVILPHKILSLQSHRLRHETWTVLDGILIAIVNGECETLSKGQRMEVSAGSVHSMANLSNGPCIVKERQAGICRENDIIRYLDAYGRLTSEVKEKDMRSVNLYLSILEQMNGDLKRYA